MPEEKRASRRIQHTDLKKKNRFEAFARLDEELKRNTD
jgi:hypothetical protein